MKRLIGQIHKAALAMNATVSIGYDRGEEHLIFTRRNGQCTVILLSQINEGMNFHWLNNIGVRKLHNGRFNIECKYTLIKQVGAHRKRREALLLAYPTALQLAINENNRSLKSEDIDW